MQGLSALAAQRGQLQKTTLVPASGFQITIFTPWSWIAQQASQSAQQGRSFTAATVTEEMLRPIVRILALPSTPPTVGTNFGTGVSSVGSVMLSDASRANQVNALKSQSLAFQRLNGLIAEFSLEDLARLRQQDPEFFVIVTGPNNQKEFKVKRKFFGDLPL